ncbi:MAG: orotidine 5'-phosphate decarboxylase, partial [Clostridiales bacterium]
MSLDRLIEGIVRTQNPAVVGLDPTLDYIPGFLKEPFLAEFDDPMEGAAAAFLEYNKRIIDAIYDIVPAVKPQAAYYEALGWQGVRALCETIRYAKGKGMFVITDGKRNDIGSTM